MKIVLDTHVLFASLASHGVCFEIVEHCVRFHQLCTSAFILEELQRNLIKKLDLPSKKAKEAITLLSSRMEIVRPLPLPNGVCRDPDDDFILATALASKCRCIITGDKDLLVLKTHKGIDIVSPSDFWKYELDK